MYMTTCSEFRRALKHIAKKLSTKFFFNRWNSYSFLSMLF
jgi:hypothetical protein